MTFQVYGGPRHGEATIGSLQEAIELLVTVHTRASPDGGMEFICGAKPLEDPLYREAWEMLRRAADPKRPPLSEINADWIRNAESQATLAAEIRVDSPQFLSLLTIARNGLRPKRVQ